MKQTWYTMDGVAKISSREQVSEKTTWIEKRKGRDITHRSKFIEMETSELQRGKCPINKTSLNQNKRYLPQGLAIGPCSRDRTYPRLGFV